MDSLNNLEKLRGDPARDFMWSLHDELHDVDFDELTETEKRHNKNLLDLILNTENIRDFVEGVRNLSENYEKLDEDRKQKFEAYTSERLDSTVNYDPETVEIIHGLADHSWNDIQETLSDDQGLNSRETMYKNRMAAWANRLNPQQLSETMIEHYMREKRDNPGRAEYFEKASKKLFNDLGWREYQETLDEVEMLTDKDGEAYLNELERLVESDETKSVVEKGVHSEIYSLLQDANSHVELAAYTETCVEHMRYRDPGKAEVMEEKVKELYEHALPTEPVH